jgi:hypothetical protein
LELFPSDFVIILITRGILTGFCVMMLELFPCDFLDNQGLGVLTADVVFSAGAPHCVRSERQAQIIFRGARPRAAAVRPSAVPCRRHCDLTVLLVDLPVLRSSQLTRL